MLPSSIITDAAPDVAAADLTFVAGVGSQLCLYRRGADDALRKLSEVTLPARVQYAWPDLTGSRLYVASSDAPGRGMPGGTHHLSLCNIDRGSGGVELHGDPVSLPGRPIHVSLDKDSAHALVAFSEPSRVRVYRILDDGSVGPEVAQREPICPGAYAHQVRVMPDGRHVTVVSLGAGASEVAPETPGAVSIYAFGAGRLEGLQVVAPECQDGFGPRHLDFHPQGAWVYVSVERQNKLMMFEYDGSSLGERPKFCESTLDGPVLAEGKQICGPIHVHPNGQFVYVANRWSPTPGTAGRPGSVGQNTLAVYEIDPTTGRPRLIQSVDTAGSHCRTFQISPDGETLVAGHVDGAFSGVSSTGSRPLFSVFRIDGDGLLSRLHVQEVDVQGAPIFWLGALSGGWTDRHVG